MFENLGVCKGHGTILGYIQVGSDVINISKIGRRFYTLLNNRIIMVAKSRQELQNRVAPVLSHIIKNISKNSQLDSARWRPIDKRYTEMITETIKNIYNNLEPVEIYLLRAKPDETQDNRSILSKDKRGIAERLEGYRTSLKRFEETKNNIQKASEVLLKVDLGKKLWNREKVMKIINETRSSVNTLSNDYEVIDGCLERSDKQISKVQMIISRKIAPKIVKDIIGNIIENFSILKSFLSEFIQVLNAFYNINKIFKKHVGYPATWFLDSEVFMDFLFEFDNLINHLIRFTELESDTIEPLLLWKIKLTGV
jgi:hypothetical protein